jgi:phosphohistidine phosphatase SixA
MKSRLLASLLLSIFTLGLAAGLQDPATPEKPGVEPITVIVVRHAEKAKSVDNPRDPELSEAGRKRAVDLAKLFEHAGVTHTFSSEFTRTKMTTAPLSAAFKLKGEVVPAGDTDQQVEMLKKLEPGSVAVVCGHSNTVPGIVAKLGGKAENLVDHPRYGPMLHDHEYGRIFVVTIPGVKGSKPSTIELRY